MEILQYKEKRDYVERVKKGDQNKDYVIVTFDESENERGKIKEKIRYNLSPFFLLKMLRER